MNDHRALPDPIGATDKLRGDELRETDQPGSAQGGHHPDERAEHAGWRQVRNGPDHGPPKPAGGKRGEQSGANPDRKDDRALGVTAQCAPESKGTPQAPEKGTDRLQAAAAV